MPVGLGVMEAVRSLVWIAVSLVLGGVYGSIMWAPFLASNRFRRLFESLHPTDSWVPGYALVAFVLSVPYTLGLLLGFAVSDTGRVVFTSAFLVSLLLATSFPVVCGFLLPRVGVDWDPTGYGASTYLLLGAGGVWYALVFLVPLTLVSVVYSL